MKEVIIIDDDEVIRLTLSTVFSRYFSKAKVRTFTSADGVQGLGYVFVTRPDLIIVDLTLPKYSGKEVIDFLSSNEFILEQKIPVIVLLVSNQEAGEFPEHFVTLYKDDENFIEQIVKTASKFLNIKVEIKNTFGANLFRKLTDKLINKSNRVDEVNEEKDRKSKIKRILLSPYIFFLQLKLSLYISIFFLFYNHSESEDNIELQKRDLAKFRVRTYSAVGVTIAGMIVVCLQVILLSGGLFSAFIFGNKAVQAASYTWDGGGDDITCGGNAGDGNKWSCALNWSLDIVPTSADTVTFDGTSTKDALVDAGFGGTITTLNINAGYTGTITQQRSLTLSSNYSQSAGIFTASNQTLDIDGVFTLNTGSVFTASSGTMSVAIHFTINGGTFNHNNGTVVFDTGNSATFNCNNITFNLVIISGGSKTVNSNCSLPLGNNPPSLPPLTLNGTLTGAGILTLQSGVLAINSPGALVGFTGITQSAGNSTLTLNSGTFDFGSYTTFSMRVININGATVTLPGLDTSTVTLNLTSGTLNATSGWKVIGSLIISGGTFNAPSGIISLSGALTISGSPTFNANGGTITFDGAGATLQCNNVTFNHVAFLNTSIKTVSTGCTLPLGNNPTLGGTQGITLINGGTLTGSGTLTMPASTTLNISTGSTMSGASGFSGMALQLLTVSGGAVDFSTMTSLSISSTTTLSSGILLLPDNADLNGPLTISGGTFTAPSGTMSLAGALTISGIPTFNANGGNIIFDGSTSATLSCNNVTFSTVTLNQTGSTKTINSNCALPLGNNPVVVAGGNYIINGTLSGTGTFSTTGSGSMTFNTGSVLTGFGAYNLTKALTVAGAILDFSSGTSFTNSNNMVLSSGSLSLPSGTDLNGALTISGGTFTAPSGSMTLAGGLTISGSSTFNANGGTFIIDGAGATLSCNNVAFNLVQFNHASGTKTVSSNCSLPLGNDPSLNGGVTGSIVLNGTLSGSGTILHSPTTAGVTLTMNAGATLSGFSGFNGRNMTISGATLDLSSYTTFITGGLLTLNSGSLGLPSGSDLNNGLTITGGTFDAPSGTLNLDSNLTITGSPTFNANGGTFNFDGTSQGTLTCNGVVFNIVTFTHTATTLKIIDSNCNLPLGSNPTVTGSIRLNSPTAILSGTGILTNTAEVASSIDMVAGQLSGFSGLEIFGSMIVNGASVDLSTYTTAIFHGRNTDNGLRVSSGTFTAPTGTMTLYDRIRRSGGTFNHNNGTVEFLCEPADTTVGTHDFSFTFFNLVAIATIPCSFLSSDGETMTVLNNLTLRGTDNSNKLSIISGVPGSQWFLDASNAVGLDLEYLNVTDNNSINRIIQTAGLNVTDGGNNTNWNFANPEISEVGPPNLIDGSYITDNKPTFEFKILDPDSANQIKYILTIDNNSDFSSPEIEEISGFIDQGELTFTPTTALEDGEYYWKLEAEDFQGGLAEVFLANEGEVAFGVDTVKPEGSVIIMETDSSDPFNVQLNITATDNLSGVSEMIISQNPNFTGSTYEPFSTTKEISFPKTSGTKGVYIKVKDRAGNESDIFGASIIIILPNIPVEEEIPDVDVEVDDEVRTYTLKVMVVNQINNPMDDIKIELHSNVQEQTTNKEGIAIFNSVSEGSHELIINHSGEQILNTINVTGENEEILVKIVVNETLIQEILPYIPIAIGAVAIVATAGLLTILSGGDIFNMFGVFFGWIYRRNKKYWGITYDPSESKVIPFATLRLYKENKFIAQSITDLKGRYGFLVEERGIFKLEVTATGYIKQVIEITVGETLEVLKDIQLSKNKGGRKLRGIINSIVYNKSEILSGLNKMFMILMIIGLGVTIYATSIDRNTTNIVLLGVYAILLIINLALFAKDKLNAVSEVIIDGETKDPLDNVSVRIYNNKRQVLIALTNKQGRVKANLPEGKYKVVVRKEGYVADSTASKTKSKVQAQEGNPFGEERTIAEILDEEFIEIVIDSHGYFDKRIQMFKVNQISL